MKRLRSPASLLLVCVATLVPLHGAEPDVDGDGWTVESFNDPVNRGGKIASARILQRIADGASVGIVNAWVRCWTATRVLDARFEVDGHAAELSGDVAWHFDRGREQRGRWRVSPSGHAIVVPDQAHRDLLRAMRGSRELHLEIGDVNGAELPVTVSLRGSSFAIGGVTDACGMR